MYGEIVCTIFRIMLFGAMNGLFNLISLWIDYMGYATMHFCQAMIIIFSGGMDAVFLLMAYQNARTKTIIEASTFSQVSFWFIVGFAVIKMIIACGAYSCFKEAHMNEHGHADAFGGGPSRHDDEAYHN